MAAFAMATTTSTYLDHASASPLDERARSALLAALDEFADPLRAHGDGIAARRLLDDARATVAGSLGAQPDEIVFTSGGTESVALAIWGGVRPVRELGTRIVRQRRVCVGAPQERDRVVSAVARGAWRVARGASGSPLGARRRVWSYRRP